MKKKNYKEIKLLNKKNDLKLPRGVICDIIWAEYRKSSWNIICAATGRIEIKIIYLFLKIEIQQ